MRKIRRIVLSCAIVAVVCCLWNQPVYATETIVTGECGENATWSLDKSTGAFTVSGTGEMYDYESGKTPWYQDRESIKTICVENGIISVGNNAFSYSTKAVSVELSDSVTNIGENAFMANYDMEVLKLDGVKAIGKSAFSNCNELSEFNWPDNLVEIGEYAFYRCEKLTNVEFPEGLEMIANNAFQHCIGIKEVTLPESLTLVGDYAFDLCTGIENVCLPDTMTELSDFIFRGCSSLRYVELPENLVEINSYAFADCVELVWIWIPDGVEKIGESAFECCTRLERILIPGSVKSIGYGAFYHCLNLSTSCYFGCEADWKKVKIALCNDILLNSQMEYDSHIYTSYKEEKHVTCVENGVMMYLSDDGTTRIEEITALGHNYVQEGNGIKWICDECNDEVTNTEDTIGYGSYGPNITWILSSDGKLTVTGNGRMVNVGVRTSAPWYDLRDSIISVVVKEGITYLGEEAFSYCINMTDVSLSDTMTEIGGHAFHACYELTNVKFPSELREVGNNAFFGCYSLPAVNLPDTVNTIGEYAFYNCESIEYIDFSKSLTKIGQWAFAYCDALQDIVMPDGLEILGDYAFDSCKGLKTVLLPNELNLLGIYAFRGCTLLESINIPEGITEIGQNTFDACSALIYMTLPENVTYVGRSAFYNCTGLKEITINSDKCTFGVMTFGKCSDNLVIKGIEGSSVELYAINNSLTFEAMEVPEPEEPVEPEESVEPEEPGEHVHNWETEVRTDVEPTCTQKGSQSIHCTTCDEIKDESSLAATGHEFEACAGKDATCTTTGYIEYACIKCSDKNVTFREEIKALGHNWSKGAVTKATVSKNGVIKYTCLGCKSVKNKTIYYPKTITLSATSYIYNGTVRKPMVTVKGSDGRVISSSNYTVSYASGRKNVGKYAVKISFKGNYGGTVTKAFNIVPKGTSISKLAKARKAFTAKWKKQSAKMATSRVSGYQIQYSTNKNFTSSVKTKTISGYSKTSKKITRLKKKKTYYVRVRTYKTVKFNGKSIKLYSGWSTVKAVKTK